MSSIPDIYGQFDDSRFDVDSMLEAAKQASEEGHDKLAVHLYISAYEADGIKHMTPSEKVLAGMRQAWKTACKISDKSSAETIFTELSPYSSPEQVQARVYKLQQMAREQLEDMGVPPERIKKMSLVHSPEATAAGADPEFFDKLHDVLKSAALSHADEDLDNIDELAEEIAEGGGKPAILFPWMDSEAQERSILPKENYATLVGYDTQIRDMRVYGFGAGNDEDYKQFLRTTSEFHGVEGSSVNDPFLFYGPSREDTYEFAEATAGEIGNPVLTLHVVHDEDDFWSIRLSGPFKKSLFGPSDPTDVPTPCTFIIENVDRLQAFIKESMEAEEDDFDDFIRADRAARAYAEVLGYIHAIMQKKDVYPMLTAATDDELSPQIAEIFSSVTKVKVDYPNFDERKKIWNSFAIKHTSFSSINIDELARLSEGISRHDMVSAGKSAVKKAYQESLATSDFRFVDINDVLMEMVQYVDKDKASAYDAIADAATEAFLDELDGISFEGNSE